MSWNITESVCLPQMSGVRVEGGEVKLGGTLHGRKDNGLSSKGNGNHCMV